MRQLAVRKLESTSMARRMEAYGRVVEELWRTIFLLCLRRWSTNASSDRGVRGPHEEIPERNASSGDGTLEGTNTRVQCLRGTGPWDVSWVAKSEYVRDLRQKRRPALSRRSED